MSDVSTSPRTVVERLIHGISTGAWDRLPELYAPDVVVEQPFGLPRPLRLDGREQVTAHFAAGAHLPLQLTARNLVVHETHDPDVIVAEFDYDGQVTSTGRSFTVANILVLTVRNGQIVRSRDYHNHAVLADVLGH
jgi:ketosteroid isomerase-like protein